MALEPVASGPLAPAEAGPSLAYLLVLVVEALVLTALYWMGRHFS
jgi:hypothetical protein